MNRVSRCDWLPERARWSILPARDKGFVPEEKLKLFWSFIPYNNLFYWLGLLGQDRYWPGFFCVFINTQEKNKKNKKQLAHIQPVKLGQAKPVKPFLLQAERLHKRANKRSSEEARQAWAKIGACEEGVNKKRREWGGERGKRTIKGKKKAPPLPTIPYFCPLQQFCFLSVVFENACYAAYHIFIRSMNARI